MDLAEDLRRLVQLFRDATGEYARRWTASGQELMADEWRYNLGDLLGDVRNIGEKLAAVYTASPLEIPAAMERFVVASLHGPDFHCRGHITRLQDVLEGRPPSWPEDTGESAAEVREGVDQVFPALDGVAAVDWAWGHLLWRIDDTTQGYVYRLRAAGMVELAEAWQRAVPGLLRESIAASSPLADAYLSSPGQLPHHLRVLFDTLHAAGSRCRDLLARLKDVVDREDHPFPGDTP